MFVTCLHAQIWNILGTSCNASYTCLHATSWKCSNDIKPSWYYVCSASSLCTQNFSSFDVSDVILSSPTQTGIGSSRKHLCFGNCSPENPQIKFFAMPSQCTLSFAGPGRLLNSLWSSWWALTCDYASVKDRIVQLTKISFNLSECQHLVGMRCGGRFSTLPSAPSQSEYITARSLILRQTLFAASRIKFITIRPINSHRYAFTPWENSGKEPNTRPCSRCAHNTLIVIIQVV